MWLGFGRLVIVGLTALETVFQSVFGLPPRERVKKKEMVNARKMSKQPPPTPTASTVGPRLLSVQDVTDSH